MAKRPYFAKENSVFDWQHKGTNEYHYMIANLKDSVVGVLGVTPLNHFDKYLTNNQVFLGLWKALEDKGIGIGIRLFKEILAKYNPKFIAGLGIKPHLLDFFRWQNFKCDIMNHHVFLSPFVKDYKVAKAKRSNGPDLSRKVFFIF